MSKYVVAEHLRQFTRSTSLAALPSFLVPSIAQRSNYCPQQSQSPKREQRSVRQVATAATDTHLTQHAVVETVKEEHDARSPMNAILNVATTTNPKFGAGLLEPYLPKHLRRKNGREADAAFADADSPVPVRNLHILLAEVRETNKLEARETIELENDLLTYLLVKKKRQDAVVWLVEAMLKEHAKNLQTRDPLSELLGVTLRSQPLPPLEDVTYSAQATASMVDVKHLSGVGLNKLTDFAGRSASHNCLGQIWRSVGSMILRATDYKPTSTKSRSIMTCVLRILAHLHHFDAIPSSVYNQAPAPDPSILQRPPTLYFWSRRIMTDLSDASLHSVNPNPVSDQSEPFTLHHQNDTDGTDLSSSDTGPPVPEVESQIWLDFVLWCCVEGGWITEAAEIVYEMWTRSDKRQPYSVIDWNTLRAQTAPKLPWTTRIKLAINSSRMREFAGGASLGIYDERASLLKPPKRTVSSEVVAAIIDGLVSTSSSRTRIYGNKPSFVEQHISICKKMLDRKRVGLESSSWDSVILRMFESLSSDFQVAQSSSTFLERIISWSPLFLQEPASANSAYHSQSMAQSYVADPSAIILGLLHRLLLDFVLAGNFRAALRIFQRLQNRVDANRSINLDNFRLLVARNPQQGYEEPVIHSTDQPQAPGLNPQLPPIVLGPLLELITDVEDLEFGHWLLYSNDVDGCIIPPNMYSDPVLQPALISFASAAGDEHILNSVMKHVNTPLPESTLRALLHHQIRGGQWNGVHEIFELLRDVEGLAWDASDVLVLAGAVLRLEKKAPDDIFCRPSAFSAGSLLQRLMSGQYNNPHDPSQPRDLSQTRLLNQLARIVASVPSVLSRDLSPFCDTRYNQLSASQHIRPRAFNHFLSTVIELFGPYEGKRLCERWCTLQDITGPVRGPYNRDAELVVEPNAQTFYTFFRRISQARFTSDEDMTRTQASRWEAVSNTDGSTKISNHPKEDEQRVLDWAIGCCLKLGLSLNRVKLDFPGLEFSGEEDGPANLESNCDPWDNVGSKTAQLPDNIQTEQDVDAHT
ncbi:MAG: hypothetical protein Q9171_003232 [Xanthocarpia ochracea]